MGKRENNWKHQVKQVTYEMKKFVTVERCIIHFSSVFFRGSHCVTLPFRSWKATIKYKRHLKALERIVVNENYEESLSHLKSERLTWVCPIVTSIRCYLLAILGNLGCWLFELTIIVANERFTMTHEAEKRLVGRLFKWIVEIHTNMLSYKTSTSQRSH